MVLPRLFCHGKITEASPKNSKALEIYIEVWWQIFDTTASRAARENSESAVPAKYSSSRGSCRPALSAGRVQQKQGSPYTRANEWTPDWYESSWKLHTQLKARAEEAEKHRACNGAGNTDHPRRNCIKCGFCLPCLTLISCFILRIIPTLCEGYIVSVHRMVMENRPVDPGSIQGSHRPISFIRRKYGTRANDILRKTEY